METQSGPNSSPTYDVWVSCVTDASIMYTLSHLHCLHIKTYVGIKTVSIAVGSSTNEYEAKLKMDLKD